MRLITRHSETPPPERSRRLRRAEGAPGAEPPAHVDSTFLTQTNAVSTIEHDLRNRRIGWGGGGGRRSLVGGRFQLAADATPWGGHSPSATGEVKVVYRGSALGARPMGGRDLGGCRHILFGSLVLCAGRISSAVVAVACARARSAPGSPSPTSPKQWLA